MAQVRGKERYEGAIHLRVLWTGVRDGGCGYRLLRSGREHPARQARLLHEPDGLRTAEVNWEFEREFIAYQLSDGFDPNDYCHTCIGENSG